MALIVKMISLDIKATDETTVSTLITVVVPGYFTCNFIYNVITLQQIQKTDRYVLVLTVTIND